MIKGSIDGLDIVIAGLDQTDLEVREAAFQGVLLALNMAFEACKATISGTDHSLRELALMGHPYGFTHPQLIHDPDVVVHIQSGNYVQHLQRQTPKGTGGQIIEGEVFNDSDLDEIIQKGTSRMRARPWMQYVVDTYGQDMADIIEAKVAAAVRKRAA